MVTLTIRLPDIGIPLPHRCEKKCSNMKACGRHQCRRRCCDGDCPPCDLPCGRRLRCGKPQVPCPLPQWPLPALPLDIWRGVCLWQDALQSALWLRGQGCASTVLGAVPCTWDLQACRCETHSQVSLLLTLCTEGCSGTEFR